MFLRHTPEGAAASNLYEFRPERTDYNRARVAEKLYSKACGERRTWEQFVAEAKSGSIAARKIALWLAMTDKHPMLRFDDVPDFKVGELTMEYSKQELRVIRAGIAASENLLDNDKASYLAGLELEIAEAEAGSDEPDPEPEAEEPQEPGKDDETAEPSTS